MRKNWCRADAGVKLLKKTRSGVLNQRPRNNQRTRRGQMTQLLRNLVTKWIKQDRSQMGLLGLDGN